MEPDDKPASSSSATAASNNTEQSTMNTGASRERHGWATSWQTAQQASQRSHQLAECPGCIAEHGIPHRCGIADDPSSPPPRSPPTDVYSKPPCAVTVAHSMIYAGYPVVQDHHQAPPPVPRHDQYPTGGRYAAYQGGPVPVHRVAADYAQYYAGPDRPRCTCGDRSCTQFTLEVYDEHRVAAMPSYYEAPPHGPIYGGHRVVYAEHYPVMGPPPPGSYHMHRPSPQPLSPAAYAPFRPDPYAEAAAHRRRSAEMPDRGGPVDNYGREFANQPGGDPYRDVQHVEKVVASRTAPSTVESTSVIGGRDEVQRRGNVEGDSAAERFVKRQEPRDAGPAAAAAASDVTVADDDCRPTKDFSSGGDAKTTFASQEINKSDFKDNSRGREPTISSLQYSSWTVSSSSTTSSNGRGASSAEQPRSSSRVDAAADAQVLPERDVTRQSQLKPNSTDAAAAAEAGDESHTSQLEPSSADKMRHHGSMTFTVDVGGGDGGQAPGKQLSDCVPAWFRRRSSIRTSSRSRSTERDQRDSNEDVRQESRRMKGGASPMLMRKSRDSMEVTGLVGGGGGGHTSRASVVGLALSPQLRRHQSAKSVRAPIARADDDDSSDDDNNDDNTSVQSSTAATTRRQAWSTQASHSFAGGHPPISSDKPPSGSRGRASTADFVSASAGDTINYAGSLTAALAATGSNSPSLTTSRGQKKRFTEDSELMHQMLYSGARPPQDDDRKPKIGPTKQRKGLQDDTTTTSPASSRRLTDEVTTVVRPEIVRPVIDSDSSSEASDDTYTIKNDKKKADVRRERERIAETFGLTDGSVSGKSSVTRRRTEGGRRDDDVDSHDKIAKWMSTKTETTDSKKLQATGPDKDSEEELTQPSSPGEDFSDGYEEPGTHSKNGSETSSLPAIVNNIEKNAKNIELNNNNKNKLVAGGTSNDVNIKTKLTTQGEDLVDQKPSLQRNNSYTLASKQSDIPDTETSGTSVDAGVRKPTAAATVSSKHQGDVEAAKSQAAVVSVNAAVVTGPLPPEDHGDHGVKMRRRSRTDSIDSDVSTVVVVDRRKSFTITESAAGAAEEQKEDITSKTEKRPSTLVVPAGDSTEKPRVQPTWLREDETTSADVLLLIHESDDEEDKDLKSLNAARLTTKSGLTPASDSAAAITPAGRRLLPEAPKVPDDHNLSNPAVARVRDVDGSSVDVETETIKQTRARDDSRNGEEQVDSGGFVVTYVAPLRAARPALGSSSSTGSTSKDLTSPRSTSEWSAELRELAESKLHGARRRRETFEAEPASQRRSDDGGQTPRRESKSVHAEYENGEKSFSQEGLPNSGAKIRQNVIVSHRKQLPPTERFVPIGSQPAASKEVRQRTLPATTRRAEQQTTSGSRSARVTPLSTSPIREHLPQQRQKTRPRSGLPSEYVSTSPTKYVDYGSRGATTSNLRRSVGVAELATSRRTRNESAEPTGRATSTSGRSGVTQRAGSRPPTAETDRRSASKPRPKQEPPPSAAKTSGLKRNDSGASRSSVDRSPDRGRTFRRQADTAKTATNADKRSSTGNSTSSVAIRRSTSAGALPGVRRAASRSPMRPTIEEERLKNQFENFRKRMEYTPSRSTAQSRRTPVGLSGRGGSSNESSSERLSSKGSSRSSTSGLSDDDSWKPVAHVSTSVACGIDALSHGAITDDDTFNTAYDRIQLRLIQQLSENIKKASDTLVNHINPKGMSSTDTKRNSEHLSSGGSLKLEEILHNLTYAERRLQSCTAKLRSTSTRRISNTGDA